MKNSVKFLVFLLTFMTGIPVLMSSLKTEAVPKVDRGNSQNSRPVVVTANTTFKCIPYSGGQYATVGQKANRTVTLIIWTPQGSSYFGEQYSPQVRCNAVTQKLNKVVTSNRGTMKGLMLTHGVVNGQNVVCVLRTGERSCNGNNSLFTLKPNNATRPSEIVNQLLNTSRYGSSSGVVYETGSQTYVSLETWEDVNFKPTENSPNEGNFPPQINNNNQPETPTEPTHPGNNGDWSL